MLSYFTGGGLVNQDAPAYPSMEDLVLESFGDVVAVQIQYRLGVFGMC